MGVQLTAEANYIGLAAHQEGFCLQDENKVSVFVMCAGDISYTVRRVEKERHEIRLYR